MGSRFETLKKTTLEVGLTTCMASGVIGGSWAIYDLMTLKPRIEYLAECKNQSDILTTEDANNCVDRKRSAPMRGMALFTVGGLGFVFLDNAYRGYSSRHKSVGSSDSGH